MLSQSQIAAFHAKGLIKLPSFYAPAVISPMRAAVWAFLQKRNDIQVDAPGTWPRNFVSKLTKLNLDAVFDPLGSAALQQMLAGLAPGFGVRPFPGAGQRQTLITFPNTADWHVPHDMWHTDLPHKVGRETPTGLQTFICLDDVAPQGGGTLVLTGSHRVDVGAAGEIASGQFKKMLAKQSPYIAALFSNETPDRNALLSEAGSFNGVELQPVELTGQTGDIYIMDMRCLHTLSPNALNTPRLVVTQRFDVTAAQL